jgi:heme/copper-type cytochrome/quinol oxidase subunit 2
MNNKIKALLVILGITFLTNLVYADVPSVPSTCELNPATTVAATGITLYWIIVLGIIIAIIVVIVIFIIKKIKKKKSLSKRNKK